MWVGLSKIRNLCAFFKMGGDAKFRSLPVIKKTPGVRRSDCLGGGNSNIFGHFTPKLPEEMQSNLTSTAYSSNGLKPSKGNPK